MKNTTIQDLLRLQFRVIGALVLREARVVFGTTSLGYLWGIITPVVSVGFLVFIFSLFGRQPPFGSSFELFFATGVLTLNFFNKLSRSLMQSFKANSGLLTYPIVKGLDTLIARLILISVTYLLIMFIFFGSLIFLGLADFPAFPEKLVAAFCATALLGFAFGTLNAVIFSEWESWKNIEAILSRPLFFLSGIFYIPSSLPPEAITILKWNPVLHLVEWMREGYYNNYNSMVLDRSYLLGMTLIVVLLGLAGERLYRKRRV